MLPATPSLPASRQRRRRAGCEFRGVCVRASTLAASENGCTQVTPTRTLRCVPCADASALLLTATPCAQRCTLVWTVWCIVRSASCVRPSCVPPPHAPHPVSPTVLTRCGNVSGQKRRKKSSVTHLSSRTRIQLTHTTKAVRSTCSSKRVRAKSPSNKNAKAQRGVVRGFACG